MGIYRLPDVASRPGRVASRRIIVAPGRGEGPRLGNVCHVFQEASPTLIKLTPRNDRDDRKAIVAAGIAGGAAYLATMAVDLRMTGRRVDDLLFLGRPIAKDRRRARLAGIVVHLLNSVVLAAAYARFGRSRLGGPGWFRGVIFANVENAALYPLTIFESHHPAIRSGELDHYWTWPAFLLSVPRHIVYGAAAGAVYERMRR